MPAAKLALGYPFDAIRRLVNAVGAASAKQLMFTAKSIDADTALRIGFVQEVVAEEDLAERVDALSGTIAGNAPLTIQAMKFIATQVMQSDPAKRDLGQNAMKWLPPVLHPKIMVEGRKAFMEKRKPEFKGR